MSIVAVGRSCDDTQKVGAGDTAGKDITACYDAIYGADDAPGAFIRVTRGQPVGCDGSKPTPSRLAQDGRLWGQIEQLLR